MVLLTRRGAVASLVFTASIALAGSGASVSAQPAISARVDAPTGLVGQSDRQTVTDGYVDTLIPALDTPVNWNGDVASCNPGTPQAAEQQATLAAINYVRSLVGVVPVSLSPDLSAKALAAATMMSAEGTLSHYPGPGFACYSPTGADAAAHSNLHIGYSGASSITSYMVDAGDNNTRAGHRRWIMDPHLRTMGSGSTANTNALWVLNSDELALPVPADAPAWLPWPTAGYFPAQLEPRGRWSLSATDETVSFSGATVSMVGPGGYVPLNVNSVEDGPGPNTVVWELVEPVPVVANDLHYLVTVSNVTRAGALLPPVSYEVALVRATFVQTIAPTISGTGAEGQTLTVATGSWRPSPQEVRVSWKRDGRQIAASGPSYTVTKWDAGTAISATVEVTHSGLESVTARTSAIQVPGVPLMRPSTAIQLRGVPRVGQVLQVLTGHIEPSPTSMQFHWFRDGKRIRGALDRKYRLRSADSGHKIRVVFTARRDGYRDLRVTTKPLVVRR